MNGTLDFPISPSVVPKTTDVISIMDVRWLRRDSKTQELKIQFSKLYYNTTSERRIFGVLRNIFVVICILCRQQRHKNGTPGDAAQQIARKVFN